MSIFNKIFNSKSEVNSSEIITSIPESWSIIQTENNGNIMLVRKNKGCEKIAGNINYLTNCGIAFKLLFPDDNGLPSFENEPEIENMEDDIFELYETDLNAIIPIIITTSGFREFVLYTKDVSEFNVRLEKLKNKYKQYELTSYIKTDKNWTTYKSFK